MADNDVFRMQVLPAGHGDCLWIDYGDPDRPTRVLVDAGPAGTYNRVLKRALEAVRGQQPSHEVFLVTHIDADHIGGSLAMLEDPIVAAQFKEVWFNGRRHLIESQQLEHFGVEQGERLTKTLQQHASAWNASFGGRPLMLPSQGAPMQCDIGGATITVLTPTASELASLLNEWDKVVKGAGLVPNLDADKPVQKQTGWEALGAPSVAQLAQQSVPEDTAPANGSSIALMITYRGKRLLLGADAHPKVLLEGIRRIQPQGRLKVDVFKLPHHGSAANVTKDLLDAVDAETVVFSSNGAYFSHPDQIAVAKVLSRFKDQGVHLVFNYKTKFNSMWDSPALRQKWRYTTDYGSDNYGSFIGLM